MTEVTSQNSFMLHMYLICIPNANLCITSVPVCPQQTFTGRQAWSFLPSHISMQNVPCLHFHIREAQPIFAFQKCIFLPLT